MKTTVTLHAGMHVAYSVPGVSYPLFGEILHVELSGAAAGMVWLRVRDGQGNLKRETILIEQILQVVMPVSRERGVSR